MESVNKNISDILNARVVLEGAGKIQKTDCSYFFSLKGEKRESLGNNKNIRKYFNSILF